MIQLNQLRTYEKVIQISQLNIRKSVTSPISNNRIETLAKVNITGPTNNVCKVSNRVYLSNANRVLPKSHSFVTCNPLHTNLRVLQENFDIYKPYNNQSSASSLNVIRSLCLHLRKKPSSISTHKPFSSVIKLSYLETRNRAHRKLQHDDDVNTDAVLENHLHCKSNLLC